GREDDGLVFCEPDGSPLRPAWVTAEFTRIVKATGLPVISLHGLRHTYAAHLVASGAHVRAIVEHLGHSSASFSLDRYAHLLPSLGAEAATRIETLVDGEGRGYRSPVLPLISGCTSQTDAASPSTAPTTSRSRDLRGLSQFGPRLVADVGDALGETCGPRT